MDGRLIAGWMADPTEWGEIQRGAAEAVAITKRVKYRKGGLGNEGFGGPPKPARGPRALPVGCEVSV